MFTTPNVRNIDADLKIQTRRVVKLPRGKVSEFIGGDLGRVWPDNTSPFGAHLKVPCSEDTLRRLYSPYGGPGDLIWVRETSCEIERGRYAYAARDPRPVDRRGRPKKWTPSILMPRKRARTILELTAVRVERLNDCSEEDARAEGCSPLVIGENTWSAWDPYTQGYPSFTAEPTPEDIARHGYENVRKHEPKTIGTARDAYQRLWESINGAGSWAANPWVWVLTFKVKSRA